MSARFKVISSNRLELFEERLGDFGASLSAAEVIVDIKFTTASLETNVLYSALVHYQTTEGWEG